ncbi:response regulator transcription factor [Clostridium sp. UBA7503]|uniref:response regulator transcription factor n=1 Tax=Clostridium sp. UBA7503 TaxID=1946377 RepID=UPI00321640C3
MKILIVEDDIELRNELKLLLDDTGYEAMILPSFYNAKEEILAVDPDLVLLDIKIPNINGQQLLKEIRKESDVPVIMVTSKDSELDEVLSMSYGADDYITKPYNPALLLLHIEALFRRMNKINNIQSYRGVKVNTLKSTLENGDKQLLLSKNEMSIFYFLLNHQGEIVTRNQIMNHLWGEDKFIDDNTLTVNITRLRKKLESIELKGVIETRREQGYILI